MTVTLYCGDCAQVMAERIPDGSIDLTVTSPPYNNLRKYNGYSFDFEAIAAQLWRVTKPGGVVVWVVADATINGSETGTSFRQALHFMALGFNLHDTMIYEVAGTGAKGGPQTYLPTFEYMFILSNGTPTVVNRIADKPNIKAGSTLARTSGARSSKYGATETTIRVIDRFGVRSNIWRYLAGNNGDDATDHPAPFPEALARDHIVSWSNPGMTVLDPMCGSGTTGKMAVLSGRNFIGIDISAEYIELARRRIDAAQQQLPLIPFADAPDGAAR